MTDCDVNVEASEGVVVAQLEGEIDMANVDVVSGALLRATNNEALGLVVDLSETRYLDSAGINVLFQLRERLRVRGQGLRLVVAPGSPVYDALRYAKVLSTLDLNESVADAVAALRP